MGSAGDIAGSDEARLSVTCEPASGHEGLRIDLAPIMDATMSEQLCDALSEAVSSKKTVHVNASPVAHISTGCIQLLLAASKSAAEIGAPFIVPDQSDAFTDAVDDLGLSEIRKNWKKTP